MEDDRISLARLPTTLKERNGSAPTYKAAYAAVVDGRIPHMIVNGRIYYRPCDLPEIERVFGLSGLPTPRQVGLHPRREAVSEQHAA